MVLTGVKRFAPFLLVFPLLLSGCFEGDAGAPGATGATGATGSPGLAGPSGSDGVDGVDGSQGPAGPAGQDGVLIAPESLEAPESPAGAFSINLAGGTGLNGGRGGDLELYIDYGSLGGNIKMFNTGVADASFTFPATVATFLGANPLNVATDLTIALATVEPAAGSYYMVASNSNIYESDGNATLADEDPVTGISVAAGATLTFEQNFSLAVRGGAAYTYVTLDNDFHNAGTVTVMNLTGTLNKGGLRLYCDTFHGAAGSAIVLTGDDNLAGAGGNGGYLDLEAYDRNWDTTEDAGAFFNQGTIDTSGGDGSTAGGNAGYVYVYGSQLAMNTGDLTARGGTGTAEDGGAGDYVEIDTSYGNNFNSGDFDASGGDGGTNGGNADSTYLYTGSFGNILNSGNMSSNGGDGVMFGGSGGDIYFNAYGGTTISSGNLSATGGDATMENAGSGGRLYSESDYDNGWYGDNQPAGNIEFSGNIDLSGGVSTSGSGGNGGNVEVDIDAGYAPDNQEIIFYGYTGLNTSGGNGTDSGGNAGYVTMWHDHADEWFDDIEGPSGGIVNHVPVTATGGVGSNGGGGDGGYFEIYTDDEYGYTTEGELAYNFSNLSLDGGDGTSIGGDGGAVLIWGNNGAQNQGNITATGGDASDVDGLAGFGASNHSEYRNGVFILSDFGPAVNGGNIDTSGGNATGIDGFGGDGYVIEIVGYSVENSGNLTTAGGDALTGTGGAGDADVVFLYGFYDGSTNSATAIDVTGGTGSAADNDGFDGEVWMDGMNVTDSWMPAP